MTNAELRQLVETLAKRDPSRSESTIQADVRNLLLAGAFNLEDSDLLVNDGAPLEAPLGDGTMRRIDIEAGFCCVETKKKLTAGVVAGAIGQLSGYVATRESQTSARYTGLLTDGRIWTLYRLTNGELVEVRSFALNPDNVDVEALLVWLEAVFATGQQVPVTPDSIAARLGAISPGFALDICTLTDLYDNVRADPEVALKRSLWAKSLFTAFGTQFDDTDELFINHTYLVTVAELVAHAAIGFDLASIEPNDLLIGARFRDAGFRGVVEADFFDWVTDVEDDGAAADGARFVRELGRRIARFDWDNVAHDVLKALYESVITTDTRHALGEYYTPDWLARRIVDDTFTDPLTQRALDPSCGSGTFLFAAIQKVKASAHKEGLPPTETIERIVTNVMGLDLHPVAVTLARVTYLLAIGKDLRDHRPANGVLIPVFLGDSMQWDREGQSDLLGHNALVIPTNVDEGQLFTTDALRFPTETLVDVQTFDGLVSELGRRAVDRKRGHAVKKLPASMLSLYDVTDPAVVDQIQATFKTMCELHDAHRDHIWAYYVRGQSRPLWLTRIENRVDVLIGNPPWVSYRYLPKKIQKLFKERGNALAVRPKGKLATHADLAAFFVVTAVDRYLKIGGRFGFVMPRGALGGPHYREFRTAQFPVDSGRQLTYGVPWDLAGVRPHLFPVPACVVFGTNSSSDPNNGIDGSHAAMGSLAQAISGKLIGPNNDSDLIVTDVEIVNADAGPQSEYPDKATQGATFVPRSSVLVVEDLTAGPLGAPSGMTSVRSRRSGDKAPWKTLPDFTGNIEDRFLRPVLLGATLVHHRLLATETAIVPFNDSGEVMYGDHPEIDTYPGLAKWWRAAEKRWDQYSSGKMTFLQRVDYQATLRVQHSPASIRVVYTTSGTYLAAAVLTDVDVIVDASAYWIPVTTMNEAHYLTAILNSDALLGQFSPLQPTGQFGTRHFHRYPFYPDIPKFAAGDPLHADLAALGKQAADEVAGMDFGSSGFQRARQQVRAHLAHLDLSDTIDAAVTSLTLPAAT